MGATRVEVVGMFGPSWIGRHVAILLADLVAKLVEIDQVEYLGHRLLLRNASRIIRLDSRRDDDLASVAVLLRACACETLPDAAETGLAIVGAQRREPE